MLFMVAAYLKPDVDKQLLEFRNEVNEHFAQPMLTVAGARHEPSGKRRGYLGFVEAGSFEEAQRFVQQGPFFTEQLYERIEVFEYKVEIGQLV